MKRSLVAALVAVVLAVVGCVLVLFYVSGAESRALTGKDPVKVVIAAKRIPAGTTGARVKSGAFTKVVVMPNSTVPADAMSELGTHLDELVVTSDVQPGQLVLGSAFGELSKTDGVALPEGKLAVTFATHCVGNVRAGSKIAIFDTYLSVDGVTRLPMDEEGKKFMVPANMVGQHQWVARLLMTGIEVMAVSRGAVEEKAKSADGSTAKDANANANAGAGAAAAPSVGMGAKCDGSEVGNGASGEAMVTVAASQEQTERLILAKHIALLSTAIVDDRSDVKPGPGTNEKKLY